MKNTNILFAAPLRKGDIGGSAPYIGPLSDAFEKRGMGVRIVYYSALERLLPPGLRHVLYGLRLIPRALVADVIIGFDTWSTGLPALFVAQLLGKKFAVRIGGDVLWETYVERGGEEVPLSLFYRQPRTYTAKEKIIRWSCAYVVRHAHALLFTTPWQRNIWTTAYRFAPSRVHILENAYPPREEGSIPQKRVFIAAGRAIRLKNMTRFMRVFEKVKERHPDIELDTRALPHAEHLARVRDSYAVVAPSISEVCPNLIIDGARFGKPFLCTNDSGIQDRLTGAGVFVDTLDEEALERGLEDLLNPAAYRQYAQHSRNTYTARTYGQVAEEMLSSVLP